jgi:hypothetical protein
MFEISTQIAVRRSMPSDLFGNRLSILRLFFKLEAGGRPGNGAKFWPNGSANKACVAGVRLGKIFHFRRPFLWFISFGRTKEMNNYYRRTKEPIPRSGRARQRQMNNLILIKQEETIYEIENTDKP